MPLLTLGIPGSGTTAVLLGALIAYGIQPGPRLFVDGAPVAEFMGAHPESAVRAFLDQHLPRAEDQEAVSRLSALVDAGDEAAAREMLAALDARQREDDRIVALTARLGFLEQAREAGPREALEDRASRSPDDLDASFGLAMHDASRGHFEEAMEALLTILTRNRRFRDDATRQAMLAIFKAMGDDPRVSLYRGRLASALN